MTFVNLAASLFGGAWALQSRMGKPFGTAPLDAQLDARDEFECRCHRLEATGRRLEALQLRARGPEAVQVVRRLRRQGRPIPCALELPGGPDA